MPALEPEADEVPRSDADVIVAIREGDPTAIDELYRRHYKASLSFAEALAGRTLAPDLVADAFVRIMALLDRGAGPTVVFRSYLYTTIRNLYVDHVRHHARQTSIPDFGPLEAEFALGDGMDEHVEASLVKRAFRSLPERWQIALWYTTVEGVSLEEAGTFLGVAPNAVAALTFRAREGLRQAYLAAHLNLAVDQTCAEVWPVLPRYVRGTLRARMLQMVEEHLPTCRRCTTAVSELGEVNSSMRGLLLIALLGGAATAGHLDRALAGPEPVVVPPAAPAVTSSGSPAAGSVSRLTPARRALVAAGAAAAAGLAVLVWPHHDQPRGDRTQTEQVPGDRKLADPEKVRPTPEGGNVGHGHRAPGGTPTIDQAVFQDSGATTAVLGAPSSSRLTASSPSWYHVLVPISAPRTEDLTLVATASAWDAFHVHRETGYGAWTCSASGSRLSCTLPAGGRGPLDLGLDLQSAVPVTVTIAVRAGGGDPVTRTFVVGR